MVFTKLLAWILYRCGNLHLPTQVVINFAGYVALCGVLMTYMKRHLRVEGAFLWVPLTSVLIWEVHYWSFQSHFHLYLLFIVAALAALRSSGRRRYLAAPCAACSMFAFSSGLVCATAVACAAMSMAYLRPDQKRGYYLQALAIVLAMLFWFAPAPPPSSAEVHAWPWSSSFWVHLRSTWARGFGMNQLAPWWFGLSIILVGLALGILQYVRVRNASRSTPEVWLLAGVFGLTMLLCTTLTSFGRGNVPGMTRYVAPRYLENVLLTLPLFWALLWHNLPRRGGIYVAAIFGLLLPFADELNARHTYTRHHANLIELRACTDAYYRGEHPGVCPSETLFQNGQLAEVLNRAQALKLSFTQVGAQAPENDAPMVKQRENGLAAARRSGTRRERIQPVLDVVAGIEHVARPSRLVVNYTTT